MQRQIHCSLHNQPFNLYCDRCLEPVCQKCTIIGPHNTTIHSLTQLPQAYERRVQQISSRLGALTERNRDKILDTITRETEDIEILKLKTKQIHTEHERHRALMISKVIKSFENILLSLNRDEENIQELVDLINDLGHQFETISATGVPPEGEEPSEEFLQESRKTDIQCVLNYEKILGSMKETLDKLEIGLQKQMKVEQLPKQLTEIRLKLKQIQTYQELHLKKVQILKEAVKKLQKQISQIQAPVIDYQQMMQKIQECLNQFEEDDEKGKLKDGIKLRKTHYVCHFCGIIMDNNTINTDCRKNQLSQFLKKKDDKCNFCHPGQELKDIDKSGYCKDAPDVSKFGTHRHYFGEPADQNKFYRVAFIKQLMGNPVLQYIMSHLPENEEKLQQANKFLNSQENSFVNYLDILFCKVKTICKVKNKNIKLLFENEDFNKLQKTGFCDLVAMEYILCEILGLREKEAKIIMDVANMGAPNGFQAEDCGNYVKILAKLDSIEIQ